MKQRITVYTVVNDECREVTFWTEEAKTIGIGGINLSVSDHISIVSLTKNAVTLLIDSPRFRHAPGYVPDYASNCVDAYDYEGKHLWNIAQIIGNVGSNICCGHVCSTKFLMGDAKDRYIEGHELFVCWDSNDIRYLIDLDEIRVIHKKMTR